MSTTAEVLGVVFLFLIFGILGAINQTLKGILESLRRRE
jgi:hypothetical protein